MKKILLLAAAATLAFTACQSDKTTEVAKKVCECAGPMVQLQNQMQAEKDTAKQKAMLNEAMKKANDTKTCMEGISKIMEEKKDDKKFQDAVQAAVAKTCPEVAKAMSGGR